MQGTFDAVVMSRMYGVTRFWIYLGRKEVGTHTNANHGAALKWLKTWNEVAS